MTVSSTLLNLGQRLLATNDDDLSLGFLPSTTYPEVDKQMKFNQPHPDDENQDSNVIATRPYLLEGKDHTVLSPVSSRAASGVTTVASADGLEPMDIDDDTTTISCGPSITLSIGRHQERGQRNYQEDRAAVHVCQSQEECAFFDTGSCPCVLSGLLTAVYDGHSGEDASKYLQMYLGDAVLRVVHDLKRQHGKIKDCKTFGDAIKACFTEHDYEMISKEGIKDGSTATVVLFDNGNLYTANCGDSRAILVRKNGTCCALTQDHKLDLESEREVVLRIARERGQNPEPEIVNRRGTWRTLAGDRRRGLAVSRSFGDREFKNSNHGLTCYPYCTMSSLSEEHVACVLASDGLWDVVTEEEVGEAIVMALEKYPMLSPRYLSEELCRMALLRHSQDNITVVVILINHNSSL